VGAIDAGGQLCRAATLLEGPAPSARIVTRAAPGGGKTPSVYLFFFGLGYRAGNAPIV
jgi:hypothetical protein